jgi:glycosyltransferase involved in cell wall biosynthesis
MKFLFLAPRQHPNYYYRLKSLLDNGHQAEFLAMYSISPERHDLVSPKILGFSLLYLFIRFVLGKRKKSSGLPSNFDLKYGFPPVSKLVYHFFRSKPDVVVVKNIASVYSWFGMILARLTGRTVVVFLQIEKFRPKPKSGSVDLVGKLFRAKVITPILGNPEYENQNPNLYYIPFAQEAYSGERDYCKNGTISILSIGKFVPRKDQLLLLGAVKTLKEKYPIRLTLVGQRGDDKYLENLREYVRDNSLEGLVEFKFNLGPEEIRQEYLANDVFVLPAYKEPAAVSPLEAMSYGLPAVCSDWCGTRCYIQDGFNGFVFKNRDGRDLENKLEKLLGNKGEIRKMGQNALESVRQNHSLEIYYKNFSQIINEA